MTYTDATGTIKEITPEQAMAAVMSFRPDERIAIAMAMLHRVIEWDFDTPNSGDKASSFEAISLNVCWALSDDAYHFLEFLSADAWNGRQHLQLAYLIIQNIRRNYATDNRPGSDRRIKAGAGDAAAGLSERTHLESHRC
jgi:hypothetical protein